MENPVLQSIEPVIKNSEHVRINEDKIREFAESFSQKGHWMNNSPFDINVLTDEEKLAFSFIFNSISFSYWGNPKWTIDYKGEKVDGAYGLIASIGKVLEKEKKILDFEYLSDISAIDLELILKGNIMIPLIEHRMNILHEIGSVLRKKFDGSPVNLLEKSGRDALKLVSLLINEFPSFNDCTFYNGHHVFFNKRAQLFASDVYQLFNGEGYGNLTNSDKLTACADYKLPKILRELSILEYSRELEFIIDNKRQIPRDCMQETEIRANTVKAIELIKEGLKERIPGIKSIHVNDCVWLLSQNKSPDDKPYHLVRTTAY